MFDYDAYTLIGDYDNNNDVLEIEYINKLRDVSPLIDEYFINNTFLNEYGPDEYTMTDLANKAFSMALAELREIGIYIDSSSYMGDYMYMSKIYEFRKVFDPLTLRVRTSSDTKLHATLTTYFEERDKDDGLEDVLYDVLYIFSTHHFALKNLYRDLQRYCYDNIVCQEKFIPYIQAILSDVDASVKANLLGDIKVTTAYIQEIYNGRVWFKNAMDLLCNKFSIPVSQELLQIIDTYDLDKIQPDVVRYFAYLDDHDKKKEDFPEYMQDLYTDLIINKHHNNSKHHYEYWEYRNIQVQSTDVGIIASLVAHHYTPTTTIDEMLEDLKELSAIMDETALDVATQMVHALQPLLREVG